MFAGSVPLTVGIVTSRESAASTQRTIVVVAGQSNALGAQSYSPDPTTHLDVFSAAYRTRADTLDRIAWVGWPLRTETQTPRPFDSAQEETGLPRRTRIFGPEVGIARQLYADDGEVITVVKVAYSATSLAKDWNPALSGSLFTKMVALVKGVIAYDGRRGQDDTIGGFVWYQGETDASSSTEAAAYKSNLAALITDTRSQMPLGTAPVVLVEESTPWAVGDAEVRGADDWAAAALPNVTTVDSSGLPREPDLIHLTNLSELYLGMVVAKAIEASG